MKFIHLSWHLLYAEWSRNEGHSPVDLIVFMNYSNKSLSIPFIELWHVVPAIYFHCSFLLVFFPMWGLALFLRWVLLTDLQFVWLTDLLFMHTDMWISERRSCRQNPLCKRAFNRIWLTFITAFLTIIDSSYHWISLTFLPL